MRRCVAMLALLLALADARSVVAQDTPPPPAPPAFQPPAILAQRRMALSDARADAAVISGLDWLRRHQRADGRWSAADFTCEGCTCTGRGEPTFDPGVTGLAVLAFLGAGRLHTEGPDAALLRNAIAYLVSIQRDEGDIGSRTDRRFNYNHFVATMALAEALWLTGDPKLVVPVSNARAHILAAQNKTSGWRYGLRDGDSDTSATVYAALALRTCEFAGQPRAAEAYAGAWSWFMRMVESKSGRVGYQARGSNDARCWIAEPTKPPRDLGSAGPGTVRMLLRADRVHTDDSRDDQHDERFELPEETRRRFPQDKWSSLMAGAAAATALTQGAESAEWVDYWTARIAEQRPSVKDGGFLDLHHLLLGSLFHAQRPSTASVWRPWRTAAVADLVASQGRKASKCAEGSWNPDHDPFGVVGGRVYATSMALLALQAPARFPVVWDPKRKFEPPAPEVK